jgi:hypothetical protein
MRLTNGMDNNNKPTMKGYGILTSINNNNNNKIINYQMIYQLNG